MATPTPRAITTIARATSVAIAVRRAVSPMTRDLSPCAEGRKPDVASGKRAGLRRRAAARRRARAPVAEGRRGGRGWGHRTPRGLADLGGGRRVARNGRGGRGRRRLALGADARR